MKQKSPVPTRKELEKRASFGEGYLLEGLVPENYLKDSYLKELYILSEHLTLYKKHKNINKIKETQKMLFELIEEMMQKGMNIPSAILRKHAELRKHKAKIEKKTWLTQYNSNERETQHNRNE